MVIGKRAAELGSWVLTTQAGPAAYERLKRTDGTRYRSHDLAPSETYR